VACRLSIFIPGRGISDRIIRLGKFALFSIIATIPAGSFRCASAGGPRHSPIIQNPQAQQQNPPDKHPLLPYRVELVTLAVSIVDRNGASVDGLSQSALHVFEDKVEQKIAAFSQEDKPASIGIIIDHSGSMQDWIKKADEAATRFLQVSSPRDEFFLEGFNEHFDWITNAKEFDKQLNDTTAQGHTALLDAVYLALMQMKGAHNSKKALLIISDGGDNRSRYDLKEIRSAIRESDVEIYAIGFSSDTPVTPEESEGLSNLKELCELSGGHSAITSRLDGLIREAANIGMEIRKQYLLGFYSSNATRDRKWRTIRVKVEYKHGNGPYKVFTRSGYWAPGP
jgi:Ca-activated chloride channel family protein